MAQIQANWPKSGQNLGFGGHNIGQIRGQNGRPRTKIGDFLARFRPLDLGHYAGIWAILLRFGPYCLDLGYSIEFGSEKAPKETKP